MDILDAMKKNAVMLQKPSLTVGIRIDLNIIQRKFYNALLFVAKQDLKKDRNKKRFAVPLPWIKELLNKKEREKIDRNNSYYIKKLIELKNKNAEYNILNKDKRIKVRGWFSLVSDLQITENEDNNVVNISFEVPERVKNALLDPKGIYANINLVVIRGLSSKYALILYEIAKDYEKVEIPEMTIEDFKKLFGIEKKYKDRVDNLKSKVLDVAVSELNDNENIDFLVSYELRKTGPKYTHIKFHVKPKPAKLKLDQQKNKIITQEVKENPDLTELLPLIPEEYRAKKNLIAVVLGGLEEKGKEYTQAQIEYTNKNAKKNYVAFLKKAIESDYAGVEVIEGAVIEEKDEWKKKYLGKKIRLRGEEGDWEIVFVDEPDDEGICKVRAKNNEGREVWATIRIHF